MQLINRSVVIIKAKPPILEWINQLSSAHPITWEQVNQDCTAILVPEFDNAEETLAYLQPLKPDLLEMELEAWYQDPDLWPAERTAAQFDAWFEFEIHSMVWDVDDSAIIRDVT